MGEVLSSRAILLGDYLMIIIPSTTQTGRNFGGSRGYWYAVAIKKMMNKVCILLINELCYKDNEFVIKVSPTSDSSDGYISALLKSMRHCKMLRLTYTTAESADRKYVVILNTTRERLCRSLEAMGFTVEV